MRSVHRSQTSQQNITSPFCVETLLFKMFFRLLSIDLPAYKIEPFSTLRKTTCQKNVRYKKKQ